MRLPGLAVRPGLLRLVAPVPLDAAVPIALETAELFFPRLLVRPTSVHLIAGDSLSLRHGEG